jgi:hypothetical protein
MKDEDSEGDGDDVHEESVEREDMEDAGEFDVELIPSQLDVLLVASVYCYLVKSIVLDGICAE